MTFKPAVVTKLFEGWNYNWVGEIIFVTTEPHDVVIPEDNEFNYMLKCHRYEYTPRSYTKGYKIDWIIISNPDSSFWKLLL